MLLLGPVADSGIDAFMKQPDEVGGAETQSCYLVVDIAAHRARVEAAGAEIVVDLRDFAYSSWCDRRQLRGGLTADQRSSPRMRCQYPAML